MLSKAQSSKSKFEVDNPQKSDNFHFSIKNSINLIFLVNAASVSRWNKYRWQDSSVVEQRIHKPKVGSSTLPPATIALTELVIH